MKLSLLLLTALICSTSAHDATASSASSEKPSKKSSRSDHQRLVALKMDNTDNAKDSLEGNDVAENNIAFTDAPEPEESSIAEPSSYSSLLEREPVEAQVILSNVEMDALTAEETMFFESTLRKAIQLAQDQEQDSSEDEVTIGAILVENGHGLHQQDNDNNNRALRGRELPSFKFFNIWTIIETYSSCRFCYDDDDIDHYEEWKKARPTLAPTPAPTPKPTFEEAKHIYGWWRKHFKNAFGGGHRQLGVSESNASFLDDILCQLLREGPHQRFWSVDECALGISEW